MTMGYPRAELEEMVERWLATTRACEAKGDWWDNKARVCAVPRPLTHWTGRPLSGAKPTPSKP